MRDSIVILLIFLGGVAAAQFEIPVIDELDNFGGEILYLLLFLAGIGIGVEKNVWSSLIASGKKMLLFPTLVCVGTILSSIACSVFLNDVSMSQAAIVGSGFGYYSLSSIMVTEYWGERLGSTALVSNISREIITFAIGPLLVRWFGGSALVASAGAASMDSLLPFIVKYSGKDFAIISFINGIVLTLLVPVILEFFHAYG